jgi:hypothetical protein
MKNKLFYLLMIILTISAMSCSDATILSKGEKIPISSDNALGYINHKGQYEINPQFAEATCFIEGLALVKSKGNDSKYGYIGNDGRYIISPIYEKATTFSEGLAWVLNDDRIVAIDKNGKEVLNIANLERVKIFSEDLAAFKISTMNQSNWGFINKKGEIVMNPQFEDVGYFSGGKCAVKDNRGKWGYINIDGKVVINNQFDDATDFNNGKAIVALGSKYGLIDKNGKYLVNPQFDKMYYDEEIFLVNNGSAWGWCDNEGKYLINPQFKEAMPFLKNKLAPVKIDNRWGYADMQGKLVINPQFEVAFPYVDGIALVYNNYKYGFIDKEGKYIINPQFDIISKDYQRFYFNGNQFSNHNEISNYIASASAYSQMGVRYVPVPTRPVETDYYGGQETYAPAVSAPAAENYTQGQDAYASPAPRRSYYYDEYED